MEETQKTSNNESSFTILIEKIAFFLVLGFSFLVPIAFNPATLSNIYDFPKWLITCGVALIMMMLTGVYAILRQEISLPSKKTLIPLGIFTVGILASSFMSTTNWRSLVYGKAGILIGFIMIFLSAMVLIKDKIEWVIYSFLISSVLVSFVQIFAFLEILPKIFNNSIMANKTFTTFGSQLGLGVFLLICLVITAIFAFSAEEVGKKMFLFVVAGLQSVALVFAIAQLLPGQAANPTFLPIRNGWSIAVDQLKTAKTAFLGVGPDNFGIAFKQLRSADLNAGDRWFVQYNSSSNEWFNILTTMGIVGLAGLILTVLQFIKTGFAKKDDSLVMRASFVGLLVLLLLYTLMPANVAMLYMLFVLGMIIMLSSEEETTMEFSFTDIPAVRGIFYVICAAFYLALPVFLGFNLTRIAVAEISYGNSLRYASQNRGTDTYNAQIKAIDSNRYNASYRIAYANTCLALANSLATKEELTDEDRTTITQLVSQAIREAKVAVNLDPYNSTAWVNLAGVYKQLINFAQGADQWALSSYVQAIRLDSTNPQLRIDLGGLLYSLGYYEDAVDQFKQAISLKPDYSNAYYNLSYSYRAMERYVEAYSAMQNVVSLVDVNSADYEKALSELKDIYELLPAELKQATPAAQPAPSESELTEPELETPEVTEQVEFDQQTQEELAPEVDGEPVESGFEDLVEETPAEEEYIEEGQGEQIEEGVVELTPEPEPAQ